jgi:hydrogenase nickel incorporation protein HypB
MTVIPIEKKVLNENQRIAASLRDRYSEHGTLTLNMISSPGSGKTTLLERTLAEFKQGERIAVLTGDLQTENDARRLSGYGYPVQQITTGGVCHLDGRMIERALERWNLEEIDLLIIENVGNLVCPSSYDLGEEAKIVLLSTTEGEDKPLKYPSIFAKSELLIITKTDLLPYVPFNLEQAKENARLVHPGMEIIEVSCSTGQGFEQWQTWLSCRQLAHRERNSAFTAATVFSTATP